MSKRYRKPQPQEKAPPAPPPSREPLRRAATVVLVAVMVPPIVLRGIDFLAPLVARALALPAIRVVSFVHHLTTVLAGIPVAGAILLSSGVWLLVGKAAVRPLPALLSRSLRVACLALVGLEVGTLVEQARRGVPGVAWDASLEVAFAVAYALLAVTVARTLIDLGEPRARSIARWVVAGYTGKVVVVLLVAWRGPLHERGPAAILRNALAVLLWVWTCILIGHIRTLLTPKPLPSRTR